MIAFFPGSFNPFTIGHLDILSRALKIFDKVVIGIGYNEHKAESGDRNFDTLQSLFENCPDVEITQYAGLTVDAARNVGATVIIRGFRNATDAEYERLLADTNRLISSPPTLPIDHSSPLTPNSSPLDTWLIPALPHLACISSSMVRELQHNNYDISPFIPTKDECEAACNP